MNLSSGGLHVESTSVKILVGTLFIKEQACITTNLLKCLLALASQNWHTVILCVFYLS